MVAGGWGRGNVRKERAVSDHAVATVSSPTGIGLICQQNHFLLRRLHSLSGIIPIGGFVAFHLFTNMQMLFGSFQHEVNFIHNMPALLFMEIGVLWLPILFHAVLGVIYTFSGVPNSVAYHNADNWRYTMQRVTGVLAFIFIVLHVVVLRWRWNVLGWYTPFFSKGVSDTGMVVDLAHYSTAVALSKWPVVVLYVAGVLSVVYHFANGLWTAAITWGATVSVAAQKRWGYACIVVFLALTTFGLTAVYAAAAYKDHAPAEQVKAYERMQADYTAGKLNFETLEHIAVAPTGSVVKLEH